MAQEIDKIIKSKYPPKDKNVLWDNGKNLMINRSGKWESANKSSNELPDSFKGWSGAANFLNNNDEPGGIIGMPFGYSGGETFSKEVNLQPHEKVLICNLSSSWYYDSVVVVIEGNAYELKLTNIKDTEYNLNGYFIIYDSNTKDFYVRAKPWSPLNGNIIVKTYTAKNKLSDEWINTGKTYGNTNEDELNNLIELLNSNSSFELDLNILLNNRKSLIRAFIIKLTGNYYHIYGIIPGGGNFITKIHIGQPSGFNINSLKAGKTLEECGIEYELTKIGIPDWADGNTIKNRTHYYAIHDNYQIVESIREITSHYYTDTYIIMEINNSMVEFYITVNDIKRYQFNFGGAIIYITRKEKNERTFIVENPSNATVIIRFAKINKLPDYYIPDTIARTSDYELPHIKLDISQTESNVTILNDNSISLIDRCVCDLYDGSYNKENALIHNGELYNGTITGIKEGNLVKYYVNFETGEVTLKHEIDVVELYNKVNSL